MRIAIVTGSFDSFQVSKLTKELEESGHIVEILRSSASSLDLLIYDVVIIDISLDGVPYPEAFGELDECEKGGIPAVLWAEVMCPLRWRANIIERASRAGWRLVEPHEQITAVRDLTNQVVVFDNDTSVVANIACMLIRGTISHVSRCVA